MAFLEHRISVAITRGSRGGPRSDRVKAYTRSRHLSQDFGSSRLLQGYDVSYGIKTLRNFEEIRDLFYVVMGGAYEGFRYKDWNDFRLAYDNSTLTLISGSDWQIGRLHTAGAGSFARSVHKLVAAPTIRRDRSGALSTASATVDVNTGIATISGHVEGDVYSALGEFDVPVTFSDNVLDTIEVDGNLTKLMQRLPSIRLEEILL
ncbi:MAG: DUF2460 domain-containing protein [Pseudomonadota bacterium]